MKSSDAAKQIGNASGSFAQIFQHQRNQRLLAFAGRLQKSPGRNINESIGNLDIRRVFSTTGSASASGRRRCEIRIMPSKPCASSNTAIRCPSSRGRSNSRTTSVPLSASQSQTSPPSRKTGTVFCLFSFGKRQSTDLSQKAADIRKRGIQFRRQQSTGFAVDNIAAGRFVKTERNFALTATKSHGGAAAGAVGDKHRLTKGKIRLYAGKNPPERRRLGFPVLFFGHPASQAAAADFGIGTGHVYFKSSSSKPRIG